MKQRYGRLGRAATAVLLACVLAAGIAIPAAALIPRPGSQDGSVGLEGTVTAAPPTQGATIVSPANGQGFSTSPTTVTGSCPQNLLVKLFNNNIFVGAVVCKNGSYSIAVQLFNGQNELVARVYDALDQAGPDSAKVRVTFTDAQYAQFGTHVQITSGYARRGAQPGQSLSWPISLSGGSGPYALSIDWGDGTPLELKSLNSSGDQAPSHTYKTAGTYNVLFRVVDKNGTAAFLQVVAVVSGAVGSTQGSSGTTPAAPSNTTVVRVLWLPAALMMILLPVAFWLGQRYELAALRARLERDSQL